MRVGLVCPYSFDVPGGVQAHVLGLARWLREAGHDAYLLSPGRLDRERARAHGLPPEAHTSTGGAVSVPYNGSVARISFGPATARRIGGWLADRRLDVLHVHEPITPSAAVLAVWAATGPVAATFHTATPGSRTMAAAGRLMPSTVRRLDACVAVSPVAADVVATHLGLRPAVVGNGIRVADFDPAPRTGPWRGGDRPRITFVGRLPEPRKGLSVLLAAVPAVLARHPDADVVVAGRGPVPAAPSAVRFVGAVSDAERNALLARTDVFVAPHTGRESFGIVILEALAAGAAVVASDIPAFAQVLDDGAGPVGRLAAPGDPAALADQVMAALASPPEAARGRRLAERYDWSVIGPTLVGTYETAIAAHGARLSGLVGPGSGRTAPVG